MPDTVTATPVATSPASPAPTDSPVANAPRSLSDDRAEIKRALSAPPAAETPPESAAPAKKDEESSAIGKMIAEARKVAAERKAAKADREAAEAARAALQAKTEPETELGRQIRQAREKRDALAALRAAGWTDEEIFDGNDSAFMGISRANLERPASAVKELTPEQLAERAARKAAAEEVERLAKERAESERVAREKQQADALDGVTKAAARWSGQLVSFVEGAAAEYPAILEYGGIDDAALFNHQWYPGSRDQQPGYVQEFIAANDRMPTARETADAFEAAYREVTRKRALALGLARPESETPSSGVPALPSAAWKTDPGAPAPDVGTMSLADQKEYFRRQLAKR